MPPIFSIDSTEDLKMINFLDNQIAEEEGMDDLEDLPELCLFKK